MKTTPAYHFIYDGKLFHHKRFFALAPFVEHIIRTYTIGMRIYYIFRMKNGEIMTVAREH